MKKAPVLKLWAVAFWLLVWQLAAMAVGKDILLVSPWRVLTRLGELVCLGPFWRAVGYTLARIAAGFFLAAALGVALAVLASRFRPVRELLSPLMLTIRTVPVASFIILALIWFSARRLSVLISFLMVLPILYGHALDGIDQLDPALSEMASVFRVPWWRRWRAVDLPQLMPGFLTGCRLALGLCWKAGVAAEVIGMPTGSVGERLQQAKVYLNTPDLFAWTVVIVGASVLFEKAVLALFRGLARALERM